jgi:NADH-quinone oxidoreductase subunit E
VVYLLAAQSGWKESVELAGEDVLDKGLLEKIDAILIENDFDGSKLVGILLAVQDIVPKRYIPEAAAYYLAEKLSLKIVDVYDCITFYASLYDAPRADYPLQVCESIVCHINEGNRLLQNLKDILGVGLNEATSDGKFIIESVPCFGACDIAPAVRVNGRVYGNLTSREKIAAMLADFA